MCVVLVDLWAFINLLREVPALRLRLETWDIVGTIAYVLAFGLIESTALLLLLMVIATALPPGLLRRHFATRGSALALVTSGWAAAVHLLSPNITGWDWTQILMWVGLYAAAVAGSMFLLHIPKIEQGFRKFVSGLVVLALIYAALGVAGVVIVLIRNQ
jgi:hypothetical protein